MNPVRILFVCHGNICRSPMAEFVMKDVVEKQGKSAFFDIASAATHADAIGSPVHSQTIAMLSEHGIPCADKVARRIRSTDYNAWDLLVGMDEANITTMLQYFGGDPKSKIHELLEYAGSYNDIADPWYSGDFAETYNDVCAGCTGLYQFLRLHD